MHHEDGEHCLPTAHAGGNQNQRTVEVAVIPHPPIGDESEEHVTDGKDCGNAEGELTEAVASVVAIVPMLAPEYPSITFPFYHSEGVCCANPNLVARHLGVGRRRRGRHAMSATLKML